LQTLRQLIRGDELIVAPVALNPIMARLAEEAGFKAIYMSGGSLGWYKCVTEANITLPEMAQVAVDMRAACKLPIVLDAGGGWGDPMHIQRTIALSEAAGFAAIEIEDQLLPRRVEHHVGIEHLVPTEFMVEKVKAAVAARTDPDFIIVARTNARRLHGLDEALRRGEAFKKAGADMVFVFTRNAEEMRTVGERVAPQRQLMGLPNFPSRSVILPRSATASPLPPGPPLRPWSRRCGSPTNAWRRARSIPSSAKGMSRRK
jgi:methylisocitrate lyase